LLCFILEDAVVPRDNTRIGEKNMQLKMQWGP